MPEYFTYTCPQCAAVRNAAHVAAELDHRVFAMEAARRNMRRQFRHAGPGRPALAHCPGCSQEMSSADLREHRIPCIREELQKLRGMAVQLAPKDPDPYPNFYINFIDENNVELEKVSNNDIVVVDLRKIAGIAVSHAERQARIRVLGRVTWDGERKRWGFVPTGAVGRPRLGRAS